MYRLVLEIDELPWLNPSANRHWTAKARERQRWMVLVRAALGRQRRPPRPLQRARVEFTRFSSREPDSDNLVASFKLCRDLLLPMTARNPGGVGILKDDDPASIVAEYHWQEAPRNMGSVRIVVEEIEDG
jgi:hypothetical protein